MTQKMFYNNFEVSRIIILIVLLVILKQKQKQPTNPRESNPGRPRASRECWPLHYETADTSMIISAIWIHA